MDISVLILAAGQGIHMNSALPKVLHPLLGKPLAKYALEAVQQAFGIKPVMVIGHGAEQLRQTLGDAADYVLQEQHVGAALAVQQAEGILKGKSDLLLVMRADMPFISSETLKRLVEAQGSHSGPVTMLTFIGEDSQGFGRVIRNQNGGVQAVVEQAQATPEQPVIREVNASVYCFQAGWMWQALKKVQPSPKGEYYLTDLVGIAASAGLSVQAILLEDAAEAMEIDTRVHLAEAEAVLRARINRSWMLAGVTLVDPVTTYIEAGVTIGQDTVIWPNTYLQGNTHIGEACTIGPNSIVRDTQIGNNCKVFYSVLESALLENFVDIGPFGHLRKGAHLAEHVHLGNFGEVKNSYLGPSTKMGHFSYMGDATVGSDVNIGAGTITCNFSVEGKKNKTEIGSGAFIGSDTMLVAPVKIGAGAVTGSGAVVTKDVPIDTIVVGVPARPIRKRERS